MLWVRWQQLSGEVSTLAKTWPWLWNWEEGESGDTVEDSTTWTQMRGKGQVFLIFWHLMVWFVSWLCHASCVTLGNLLISLCFTFLGSKMGLKTISEGD